MVLLDILSVFPLKRVIASLGAHLEPAVKPFLTDERNDIKIIAVTASLLEENRQEVLAGGADDFIGKPFREVELFQKIQAHLAVEYIYAEEPAAAAQEGTAEITPESLAGLPHDLIHPMREAVISADLDQLLAKIQEVEARDLHLAQGLRRLAERFEYQKLLDLFGPGEPSVSSLSLVSTGVSLGQG